MKANGLSRRRFNWMGLTALGAGSAWAQMDVATHTALGLDKPIDWSQPINGHTTAEVAASLNPPEDRQYNPCAEAYPPAGAPRGTERHIERWNDSRIFDGTTRDIWIYRPAQLDTSTLPPDLIVFQDGAMYRDPTGPVRATAVLDTLIHTGELRPTVGVFVNPGARPNESDPLIGQRSFEYDSLTDTYVRFVMDELLPLVEDEIGRPLSTDPARRIICGISSGGICAWTAAWFRPDAFGRVLSHCGSFTNIRGGHNYPYLVRTTPRKPIRAFLTSGAKDLDIPLGDWALANKQMAAALEYAGYDHEFVFGEGGHSLRHGGAMFGDSLRWLMR